MVYTGLHAVRDGPRHCPAQAVTQNACTYTIANNVLHATLEVSIRVASEIGVDAALDLSSTTLDACSLSAVNWSVNCQIACRVFG